MTRPIPPWIILGTQWISEGRRAVVTIGVGATDQIQLTVERPLMESQMLNALIEKTLMSRQATVEQLAPLEG